MIQKPKEKERAISLRRRGLSYFEILQEVPVAKSTLSLWLRSVGLSNKQEQRLTDKKLESIRRGWMKWHQHRIDSTNALKESARRDIGSLSRRELWIIGIALYWAEGSKQKEYLTGQGAVFNNSDPEMIKVFLRWLRDIIEVNEEDICFEVYLHENHKNNVRKFLEYWACIAEVDAGRMKFYFKRNKIKTNRKNIGDNYRGLLRVKMRRSSALNRRISGWIEGIVNNIAG